MVPGDGVACKPAKIDGLEEVFEASFLEGIHRRSSLKLPGAISSGRYMARRGEHCVNFILSKEVPCRRTQSSIFPLERHFVGRY